MSDEFDLDYSGEEQQVEAVEEAPAEEAPAEVSQTEETEEGAVAEGETPAEEEAQPEDDLESLRQQLASSQLALLQLQKQQAQQVQPQAEAQPSMQLPNLANEVTSVDFLGGEDHVSILESAEKFNALLNKVATVSANAAIAAAQERILRQIPQVVETTANQQMRIKDIVGRFYQANKDLEAYKPAVSMAAIQLHNANPSISLEELLSKAADETRKVLKIKAGTVPRRRVPAQPVGSGKVGGDRTSGQTTLTEQEQQILELLS